MAAKAKKQARKAPKLTKTQERIKVLHKAGLTDIDYRKVGKQPSGATKRLVKRYADVIPDLASGKAKTVSVKSAEKGTKFGEALKVAKGRAVVRVENPKEKVRYNKRTNTFTSKSDRYDVPYRRVQFAGDVKSLADLPEGKGYLYYVRFRSMGEASYKFTSVKALADFMAGYEDPTPAERRQGKRPFKNWQQYIEVLEPINASDVQDDESVLDRDEYVKPKRRRDKRATVRRK